MRSKRGKITIEELQLLKIQTRQFVSFLCTKLARNCTKLRQIISRYSLNNAQSVDLLKWYAEKIYISLHNYSFEDFQSQQR